uniref:Secreted protein n=1 Tax=Ixodes ricinus TaxID=34613 RepID=A0A6B0U897_IXORI
MFNRGKNMSAASLFALCWATIVKIQDVSQDIIDPKLDATKSLQNDNRTSYKASERQPFESYLRRITSRQGSRARMQLERSRVQM